MSEGSSKVPRGQRLPSTDPGTQEVPILFFFSFHFWPPCSIWKLLGQGSDLSHSHNLSRSCGNAGTLTHCTRLGIEPATQCSQDAADPIIPQREILVVPFHKKPLNWSLAGESDGCVRGSSDHEAFLVKHHFGQSTAHLRSVQRLPGSPNPASLTCRQDPHFPKCLFSQLVYSPKAT